MEYNSERPGMILPEYGRNIQKMVHFALTVEDREERNKVAQGIINVMGMLNPHLRDVEEFKPKLWAHLFIMSDFALDVDSPFPIPNRETFQEKPRIVAYPKKSRRYKHYGQTVQSLIKHCRTMEEGDERDALALSIANLMKRSYLAWNRDSVTDDVILQNLTDMSDGEVTVKDPSKITATQEILKSQGGNNSGSNQKRGQKKGGKKGGHKKNYKKR